MTDLPHSVDQRILQVYVFQKPQECYKPLVEYLSRKYDSSE